MKHPLKRLCDQVANGSMSRRDLLLRVTALGISSLAAEQMLVVPAVAQTPKIGGLLRIGATGGSTTATLDPAETVGVMNVLSGFGLLRNNLVDINEYSKPVPGLAESWDVSADVATWTFQLRKGVEFHNGKTLEADDVVDSINHHRSDDSGSSAKTLLEQVENVRTDGKDKVIFQLKDGNADFPVVLSSYQFLVFPAGTTDFEKGVGTGPYILESWEPGVRMQARRNPNYFREGKPHFDEVHVLGINDVTARTNALQTGEVDIIDECDLKTAHLLERNPDVQVFQVSGTKHFTIPMHVDVAPFDDPNVRTALKYGIDRQAMLNTILHGYGSLGNDHPIASSMRFHAELPQTQYDPEKARFHLKRAGHESLSVSLAAADIAFAGAIDMAVLYREQASVADIDINVERVPDDGYWSNIWLKRPWCMAFWAGRPTEDLMFSSAYAAGAAWNDTHWNNSRFNELLVNARKELDENKRREMYAEMQMLCREDGGVVVPLFANHVQAANSNLRHGTQIGSNWQFDGHKVAERWWWA